MQRSRERRTRVSLAWAESSWELSVVEVELNDEENDGCRRGGCWYEPGAASKVFPARHLGIERTLEHALAGVGARVYASVTRHRERVSLSA